MKTIHDVVLTDANDLEVTFSEPNVAPYTEILPSAAASAIAVGAFGSHALTPLSKSDLVYLVRASYGMDDTEFAPAPATPVAPPAAV